MIREQIRWVKLPRLEEAAFSRLESLPDAESLCHGDLHTENILVTPKRLIAIDWATAASGHPLADVAKTMMLLKTGRLPRNSCLRFLRTWARNAFCRVYVRRYLNRQGISRQELKRWELPMATAQLGKEKRAGRNVKGDQLMDMIEDLLQTT